MPERADRFGSLPFFVCSCTGEEAGRRRREKRREKTGKLRGKRRGEGGRRKQKNGENKKGTEGGMREGENAGKRETGQENAEKTKERGRREKERAEERVRGNGKHPRFFRDSGFGAAGGVSICTGEKFTRGGREDTVPWRKSHVQKGAGRRPAKNPSGCA